MKGDEIFGKVLSISDELMLRTMNYDGKDIALLRPCTQRG